MRKSPREHLEESEEMLLAASDYLGKEASSIAVSQALVAVATARIQLAQAFAMLPSIEQAAVLQGKVGKLTDKLTDETEGFGS